MHTTAPSGSPMWLTVRGSLPTSVQLSWGAVPKNQRNGEIAGYSIQVEGPDTMQNIQTNTSVSKDLLRIPYAFEKVSDLKPSTEYSFSVSAKTVAGSGPAISVSFVTPQEGKATMHT